LAGEMLNGKLVVDKSLVHIGGREKRNLFLKHKGIKNAKARITCGQEDVPTLIGQSIVTLINKSLQMMNSGFNWGGRINGRQNFKNLVDKLDLRTCDGYINVNTDFNGHDNNVSEEKVVLAFALLRCCFPEGRGIDNIFYYCLSGMVFKRLVLPESGLIYEVSKGVLSGHAFTSIITTICAYITISTALNNTCDKDVLSKTCLQGAGDDWIMRLPKDRLNFIHNEICRSGNPCDDLSEDSGDLKDVYPNKFPTFLKKHYLLGNLAWNVNELFTNFVYPTSRKMKLYQLIMDKVVMCVSGPFNNNINYCCKKLIIYHFMDKYCKGRHGFHQRKRYKAYFDNVMEALLYEQSIDVCIARIPKVMRFGWIGQISGGTCDIELREIVKVVLKDFDNRVRKSRYWMLRPTIFERHESVRRLKVFDINKVFVPAYFPFQHVSFEQLMRSQI
jgi:hypothetical protein